MEFLDIQDKIVKVFMTDKDIDYIRCVEDTIYIIDKHKKEHKITIH